MPVQIIAEGEINHNDMALAKRMVESARASGVDLIRFQCLTALGFIARGSSFLPLFQKLRSTRGLPRAARSPES